MSYQHQSHHQQQFASCQLNLRGSLPSEFSIPTDIIALSSKELASHSFDKELELIAQYSDWIQAARQKEEREKALFGNPANQDNQQQIKVETTIQPNGSKDNLTSLAKTSGIPVSSNESKESVDLLGLESFEASNAVANNSTQNAAVVATDRTTASVNQALQSRRTSQETTIQTMMAETQQPSDVCQFYLESANWNLEQAIELMRSMEVR